MLMRRIKCLVVAVSLLVTVLGMAGAPGQDPSKGAARKGPAIRLNRSGSDGPLTFEVAGLDPADLAKLANAKWDADQWTALFAVYVDGGNTTQRPPVLGSYRLEQGAVRFEPQFPLTPGVRCKAVFNPAKLPGQADAKRPAVVSEFAIPKAAAQPTTLVQHVYPSGDTLPENQLRFYLHFSAPMRQGDVYRHIRLLDADGKPITDALLELEDELWDRDGR